MVNDAVFIQQKFQTNLDQMQGQLYLKKIKSIKIKTGTKIPIDQPI